MPVTLIRASQIQNVPVGNPLVNLPVIIKADTTETAFSNSAAENTYYTYSLPGGILGINDAIRMTAWVSILNNSAAPQTYTFRYKYGGSTLHAFGLTLTNNASAQGTLAQCIMKNAGATNSQKGIGVFNADFINNWVVGGIGTSAIDSTVNQNIVLTIQSSAATATQTVTLIYTELTYLKST